MKYAIYLGGLILGWVGLSTMVATGLDSFLVGFVWVTLWTYGFVMLGGL